MNSNENDSAARTTTGPYGLRVLTFTGTTNASPSPSTDRGGDDSWAGLLASLGEIGTNPQDLYARARVEIDQINGMFSDETATPPAEICAYCETPIWPGTEALPLPDHVAPSAPNVPLHAECRNLWIASTGSPLDLWRAAQGRY